MLRMLLKIASTTAVLWQKWLGVISHLLVQCACKARSCTSSVARTVSSSSVSVARAATTKLIKPVTQFPSPPIPKTSQNQSMCRLLYRNAEPQGGYTDPYASQYFLVNIISRHPLFTFYSFNMNHLKVCVFFHPSILALLHHKCLSTIMGGNTGIANPRTICIKEKIFLISSYKKCLFLCRPLQN